MYNKKNKCRCYHGACKVRTFLGRPIIDKDAPYGVAKRFKRSQRDERNAGFFKEC